MACIARYDGTLALLPAGVIIKKQQQQQQQQKTSINCKIDALKYLWKGMSEVGCGVGGV